MTTLELLAKIWQKQLELESMAATLEKEKGANLNIIQTNKLRPKQP